MLFKAVSLNLLLTLGSVAASSLSERAPAALEARVTCGANTVKILGKCYCKSIAFKMDNSGNCGCDDGFKVSGLLCIADCPASAYVNWKNQCACRKNYLKFKEGDCKCDKEYQYDDGSKCTDICPGPHNTWVTGTTCQCEENYVPAEVGCVRDCSNGATPTADGLACECKADHFVLKANNKECECGPDYVPGEGADSDKCVPKCFNGATPKADHTCECKADNFVLTSNNRECECDPDFVPGEGADSDKCVPKCFNGATPKADHTCECKADNFVLTSNNRECECDPDFVPGEGTDSDKCVPKCFNGAIPLADHSGCKCSDDNAVLKNNERECECKTKYELGTAAPHDGVCIPSCSNGAVPKDDLSGCKCTDTNAELKTSEQECQCKALFKDDAGSCVPDCGTATPKSDNSGCECKKAHFQLKTNQVDCECTPPFVPGTGANSDKCVPVCVAPATLKADGSACQCPNHAHLKDGDLECECDSLYKLTTKPNKQPTCIYDCGSAKLNPTFDGCICDKPNTEFKNAATGCGCKAGYTGLSRFGCVSDCGTTDAKWNSAKSACICNVKAFTYTPASDSVSASCACAKSTDVYEEGDGVCHEPCGNDADWNKKSRACICRKKGMQFNNGACACPKPDEQKWNGSKCVPDCGDDAQYDNKQARCVCLKRGQKWANKVCSCDAGFTWKNQNKGCVANP